MYIPVSFFSNQNLGIIATTTTNSASAFSEGGFVSGSELYGYFYWGFSPTNQVSNTSVSGSLTIKSGSTGRANITIIAGGGGAGDADNATPVWAGGGGGGGIVRYNNFPLSMGTYQIYVGKGGAEGASAGLDASNGENSYIQMPIGTYTPFTSSYLIAFGGGGGVSTFTTATGTSIERPGLAGGSNGGSVQRTSGAPIISPTTLGVDLGGLNGLDQGNKAGLIPAVTGSTYRNTATGGGGAASASADISAIPRVGNGGDGLFLKLYGYNQTSSYYSGGGGAFGDSGGGAGYTSSIEGLGGLSYNYTDKGAGGSAKAGNTIPFSSKNPIGSPGLVYIEYPIVTPFYPNTMINDGLTFWTTYSSLTGSYWYDISGNQNTGSVSGSTITPTNNLVPFNGTNNSILFPVTMSAQPSSSMTMIIYGQFISSSQNRDLFCREDYTNGWDTIYSYSNSRLTFRDNAGADGNLNVTQFVNQNVCYAITVTNNSQQSFVNGNKFSTATAPFNGFTAGGTKNLAFGFNANSDATYFSGSVSDLLLYNRILSQSEILSVYNYLRLNQSRPTY